MSGDVADPGQAGVVRSTSREYYEAILIAVIFALFVRTFVVQAFKIPSGSMEDNLLVGDHILVDKVAYGPHSGRPWDRVLPYRDLDHGDVVVFKWPEDPTRDFIKRCIGLPGETIEIRDGAVSIDGRPRVEQPEVFFKEHDGGRDNPHASMSLPNRDNFRPYPIPEKSYFMMGDNRDRSYDSRFWGTVPRDYVKGKALLVYWSFDSPPQGPNNPTIGETLKQLGDVAIHFFSKTRWSRTFRIIR